MKYIYDLHHSMLAQNLILVYEGEFTQEITKSVLAMAERNMDSTGEESVIKRKVFNIMVECLQNIVKHSEESKENQSAIFMIGRQEGEYIIMSGNPMNKGETAIVKEKLDKINSLDKDGLKSLYKDIMKTTQISDKGGAGLGFVDMARKSGRKLEYDFFDLDDKCSFFCLKATIGRTV